MIKIKNCAIYGGSFDPIHLGHIHLVEEVKKSGLAETLIVVPAGKPWQRETHASAKDRLAMAQIALASSGVIVSDCEINRPGNSYAIDTVTELSKTFHADRYLWVIGSDAFATIESWHRFAELVELVEFLVISRPGYQVVAPSQLIKWENLEIGALDISATQVREALKEGRNLAGLLTPAVSDYIREHRLYGAA